jgi:uncharacterized protein YjdB
MANTSFSPGQYPFRSTLYGRIWIAVVAFLPVLALPACDATSTTPTYDEGPARIQLSMATLDLERGDTSRLSAVVLNGSGSPIASPSAGTLRTSTVSWTTSDPSIATISRSGLILAQRGGQVTVTARSGALFSTSTVSVQSKGKSITISPKVDTLHAVGHTLQLSVTVLNGAGKEVTNPSVTWTSQHPAIADVNSNGLVKAVAAGAVMILASSQGQTDSARVVVLESATAPPPVVSVVKVAPGQAEAEAGATTQFHATVKDGSGAILTDATVVWSSSDREVAVVGENGAVTAKAAGSATIRATADGKSGSAGLTVWVSDAPPPATPDFAAIKRGIRPRGFGTAPYALSQPAAGGNAYFVAPTGNDSNPGTGTQPFRTINKAAQVAVAGDVVTIRDGSYQESVLVRNSGTVDKRIVFQAENRGGVVMTGGQYTWRPAGWQGVIGATPQRYVTIKGLVFREYAPNTAGQAAIRLGGRGWRLEDCLLDNAGFDGVTGNDHDMVITRSTLQNHFSTAYSVYGGSGAGTSPEDPAFSPLLGFVVSDNVIRGNHTRSDPVTGAIGTHVSKIAASKGAVIENNEILENRGSGIWFDEKSIEYTIRYNYIHSNVGYTVDGVHQPLSGRGIKLEKLWRGGVVESNLVVENEGPGVLIVNTNDLLLRGNLIAQNGQGIAFVSVSQNTTGYTGFVLERIRILDNFFKDWGPTVAAIHPWGGDAYTPHPSEMEIYADGNTYEPVRNPSLGWWANPIGAANTVEQSRSKFGWETNGRVASITVP